MERETSASPQIGDLLELEIEKLIFQGAGLARWKGMVVLLPHCAAGDRLVARVSKIKGHYLEAEAQEILSPSPERVLSPCPHFPACGACQWLHLSPAAQRKWKERILREQVTPMERWGSVPIWPILPVSDPLGYRTRAQIKVGRKGNRSQLGFFRPRSSELEEIDVCPLLHPDLQGLYASLRALKYPTLAQLFPALKEIWIQRGFPKGELTLALLTPFGERPALRLLHQRLRETCPALSGISLIRDRERGFYDQVGNPWVEMTIGNLVLRVGSTCFYQVGERGAEGILHQIEAWIGNGGLGRVLDLYCGVGTFSLPLARRAEMVLGVEAQTEAAHWARENAQRYGLSQVEILQAAAEEALLSPLRQERFDLALLDPPRSGVSRRTLEGLLRLAPPRMIYISCDPSTLARDLGRLMEGGYRCQRIQPLDLFPQTYHLETLVLLERII